MTRARRPSFVMVISTCNQFAFLFTSFVVILRFFSQAVKGDGWNTEPFTLVVDEKTGQLIGRGASDDKGPVLGWVNVLQAHKELGLPLPVNLKFCFEGMEEYGSEGLDELIKKEAKGFFKNVDAACIVCDPSYCLYTA